ncbi:gamma subclass chorismate mutase AroQ [Streptomyces iconiensis]|uniref:chorismate mutase n=1 Tax=Streptomyces iconiensis TaxID=1384038 RepID=A0ABT7A572_9ACTN|nr:gamma subclass chorismate mutase AroQ [Streptomyces iconiensis]MDJ1136164.1 gamma subclass chorismate mutase AroQ [Streptomyces iconiensis]
MHLRSARAVSVSVPALALAAAVLAPGAGTALAGQPAGQGAGVVSVRGGPAAVAEASAERLELAGEVAAAKYGTGKPIDDPARERDVLRDVAGRAGGLGVGQRRAAAVFRDQIEANKAVQRGLHAYWDAHPEYRPVHRPDLAREVRPALDRLTGELLNGLAATRAAHAGPSCSARLAFGGVRAAQVRHFDALHTEALVRAVRSVC